MEVDILESAFDEVIKDLEKAFNEKNESGFTLRERSEIIEKAEQAVAKQEITKKQSNTLRLALQKGMKIDSSILKHLEYGVGYTRGEALIKMGKAFEVGVLSLREHSILEDKLNRKQVSPTSIIKALRDKEGRLNAGSSRLKKSFGTVKGLEVRRKVLDELGESLNRGEITLREHSRGEDAINQGTETPASILKALETRRQEKGEQERLQKSESGKNLDWGIKPSDQPTLAPLLLRDNISMETLNKLQSRFMLSQIR